MICRDGATDLGAYVLGALEAEERDRVDEHLRGCPGCATELAELEALPALLDRVDPDDLRTAPVPPSPELFERMSAAAGAPRRRARRRLLVAAAVLAVLGAGGVTTWVLQSEESSRSVQAGAVRMTVTATAQGDGTSLDVTVAGLPAQEQCRLIVVDRDGTRHQAGEWTVTYGGEAWFKGWSDVDRSAVDDVVLLGTDGRELVRVPL